MRAEIGREQRRLQGQYAGNMVRKQHARQHAVTGAPVLAPTASIFTPSTRHAPSQNVESYVQHRFRAMGLDLPEIEDYIVEVISVLIYSEQYLKAG